MFIKDFTTSSQLEIDMNTQHITVNFTAHYSKLTLDSGTISNWHYIYLVITYTNSFAYYPLPDRDYPLICFGGVNNYNQT